MTEEKRKKKFTYELAMLQMVFAVDTKWMLVVEKTQSQPSGQPELNVWPLPSHSDVATIINHSFS